jgi:hypothetical protein
MSEIGSIMQLVEGFRARQLSIFGIDPANEIGSMVARERILPPNDCEGRFRREAFVQHDHWRGLRLRGRAMRKSDRSRIDSFLTTGLDLRVIGAGFSDVVYASVRNDREPFIVYGLLKDGKVCAIPVE